LPQVVVTTYKVVTVLEAVHDYQAKEVRTVMRMVMT
jgi:hypothetical protein